MEIVKIGKRQSSKLSNQLSRMVLGYAKDARVEAICMISYKDHKTPLTNIELLLICKEYSVVEELDRMPYSKKNFGTGDVAVKVTGETEWNFSEFMMENREVRNGQDLISGEILFDRNGKFTSMREYIIEHQKVTPFANMVLFEPPLTLQKVKL